MRARCDAVRERSIAARRLAGTIRYAVSRMRCARRLRGARVERVNLPPRRALSLLVLVASSVTLLACPPADKREPPPSKKEECSHVGQSCEFSPGKLGSCVYKDDCVAPANCYVCQSQH